METKRKSAKVVVSLLALVGLAVFSLFAVGGSLEPSAPPGPTMKTLDEVEPRIPIQSLSGDANATYIIDQPGSYYLAGDVNNAAINKHAIVVEVNDVTIDLMGYQLKGPASPPHYGIWALAASNVEVRNGTVQDFYFGIYADNNANKCRILNVRVIENKGEGIWLSGSGHLVKDCTAVGNHVTGIRIGPGSTVTGNTCNSNGENGIYASSGSTVSGNTAYENAGHGIDAGTGCTIIGNTARINTGNGIDFEGLGTIADNTADRNSAYGISVNSGAVVARNSCAENTLDGIKAGDGNRIVGNDCVGNGNVGDGAGIHVQSQRNVIMDNTVLQNDRGIDVDAANNLIVKNSASTNGTEYDIAGGNKVGTISTNPTTAGPWDNFDF